MRYKNITIFAGYSTKERHGGWQYEDTFCETIKEAKKRAKYLLTEDYQRLGEMSEPFKYAQVVGDGDVLYEFYAPGYNGELSQIDYDAEQWVGGFDSYTHPL